MSDREELLKQLYRAFNARDINAALSGMREDVIWANGMEGGNVHGMPASANTGRGNGR
jgi:ketosteroid isomerase-like protein